MYDPVTGRYSAQKLIIISLINFLLKLKHKYLITIIFKKSQFPSLYLGSSKISGLSYQNELTDDLKKGKKTSNIRKQRLKIRTWITLVSEIVFFLVISRSSKCNLD